MTYITDNQQLSDYHSIYKDKTPIFEESRQAESVLNRPDIEKTKFTEWFEANEEYPDARDLTYSDFPTRWVWNVKKMD